MPVATPEDLIVLKLFASRQKDRAHALALVKLPDLDWEYVETWCAAWEISGRLTEGRQASDAELREIRALYSLLELRRCQPALGDRVPNVPRFAP